MKNINPKEIISDENINILREVLGTPEKYLHHLEVLETTRDMIFKKIEEDGLSNDHYLFPLFDTLNNLYGAFFNIRTKKRCQEEVNSIVTIEI